MISTVKSYLAVRRAAGFELTNTEYLLRSFARWRQARRVASKSANTCWPWRPTWVTSTSMPLTGIWKPRPNCCGTLPEQAEAFIRGGQP